MREWIGNAVKIISEHTVLDYLWGLCLSVSAVIVFFLLIRPFMKRLPRIGMYLLWLFMVVRMICPFSVSGIYELFPERVGQTVAQTRQSIRPEQLSKRLAKLTEDGKYGGIQNAYRLKTGKVLLEKQSDAGKAGTEETLSGTVSGMTSGSGQASALQNSQGNVASAVEKGSRIVGAGDIIFMIWLAGVLFCVLYLVCSLRMNQKMFRHAVPLFENVYEHPYVCSSFVGGIISPKIYVPKGMSEADLECILVHERTHIKRRDYRVKPFVFLVLSILWFNPLVWVAYRLMMRDMEVSCDEAVVRKLGNKAKKRYSYLLLAMASGENHILCSNAAFGAGAVNERIRGVMKYKKPTKIITALAVLAVALCGCGISSVPEETAKPQPEKEEEAVYVEQTMPEEKIDWGKDVDTTVNLQNTTVDPEGKLVQFGTLYAFGENGKRSIDSWVKVEFVDGEWQKAEITWEKECEKLLKGKKLELADGFYGPDGFLYLVIHEFPDKYYEEAFDEDNLYLTAQYFFRVNEETGEVTDLKVPSEDWDKVFPDDSETGYEKGLVFNDYVVFADGNYLIYNYGGISAVYSGSTGEEVAEIKVPKSAFTRIESGDDFVCWAEANQDSGRIEVKVFDESGQNGYVLDAGVPYKEGELAGIALGTKGNSIIIATEKGIAEAEYGGDEFTTIASAGKDNLYYLSEGGYKAEGRIVKGIEDYHITLIKNEQEWVNCHYTKSN